MPFMTPEYAYQEALRRIRGAEEATALDLSELLNQIPRELGHLTSVRDRLVLFRKRYPNSQLNRLADPVV